MGLFDFVKEAGERIFDRDDDDDRDRGKGRERHQPAPGGKGGKAGTAARETKSAPSATATATPTFEEVRERALEKAVERNGFNVQGLNIDLQGDRAVVTGRVATQEIREKVILVVGNTAGIAKVDDRLEVERKEPQRPEPARQQQPSTFYTVKPGDTLSKIAQQHYGKASEYLKIFEANRPMLKDPDQIYPGQVLRIPAGD